MSQKEEVINSAEESKPRGLRVKPTIFICVAIYLIYLAIFYGTWAINGVDYPRIGESATTAKLWYAMPTLLGSAFVAIAVTALGWWRVSLFDKVKSGPKWFWIMPVAMILVIIGSYATTQVDNLSSQLLIWCILGGLGVGFGEEMITRGSLIVGLRSKLTEGKVWLISTLLFSALHIPNVIFGLPLSQMPSQLILTFIMGSAFYAIRRVSGTLILTIVLHGLWDSSVFLPQATGSDGFPLNVLLYPLAIICVIPVILRNRKLKIDN